MGSPAKSIRVDPGTAAEIERLSAGRRTTFSALAAEMLSEAARMRRCPGILFADGPAGRRARIEGTGIEVWEVISSYLALDRDDRRLQETYHWLSDRQILAALGYYRSYPEEIEELVRRNRAEELEEDGAELPFARRLAR
jgi:uncharacterized protein (DUF433 family)